MVASIMPRILPIVTAAWGCFVIVGTYKRWRLFVLPRTYQMRHVRKRHGEETLVLYSYAGGVAIVAVSLVWWLLEH